MARGTSGMNEGVEIMQYIFLSSCSFSLSSPFPVFPQGFLGLGLPPFSLSSSHFFSLFIFSSFPVAWETRERCLLPEQPHSRYKNSPLFSLSSGELAMKALNGSLGATLNGVLAPAYERPSAQRYNPTRHNYSSVCFVLLWLSEGGVMPSGIHRLLFPYD